MKNNKIFTKRQAISKANSVMFAFIAMASLVVGVALVVMTFILQDISFKAKIIGEQNTSLANIDKNIKNVKQLEEKIKGLQTNEALKDSRINDSEDPLRVIMDALPVYANSSAVGAGLTDKIIGGENIGVTIDQLSVDNSSDSKSNKASSTSAKTVSNSNSGPRSIGFMITLSAKNDDTKVVTKDPKTAEQKLGMILQRIERSIRTYSIDTMKLSYGKEGTASLVLTGKVSYSPEKTLTLSPKTIVSGGGNISSKNKGVKR